MRYLSIFLLAVVGCGPVFSCSSARANDAETLAQIDKQLAEITTFQYERNGDLIRDLETTLAELPANSPLRPKIEDKLVASKGGANAIGRGIICRQLRVIGTDKCIPTVAALLADPQVAEAARGLQAVGSEAAFKAMYEALGKSSGAVQVGLINSLAEVAYEPLRADSIGLIQAKDPLAAAAAVRVFGKLGGSESIAALMNTKGNVSPQLAADIDLALVACAEKLVQAGHRERAKEVFAALYQQSGPSRLAALRGLVIADPDQAVDLLLEAIRGQDSQLAMWAINLTPSAPGKEATEKFVAILDKLPADSKVLMLKALGQRGDAYSTTAVIAAANSESASIRLAALEALGGFQGDEAIDTLLKIPANDIQPDQRIARASLAHGRRRHAIGGRGAQRQ